MHDTNRNMKTEEKKKMGESLIEIMEKTKLKIELSVNQAIRESGLPFYLAEGIVAGVLCDIKDRKNAELLQTIVEKEENEKRRKEEKDTQNKENSKPANSAKQAEEKNENDAGQKDIKKGE